MAAQKKRTETNNGVESRDDHSSGGGVTTLGESHAMDDEITTLGESHAMDDEMNVLEESHAMDEDISALDSHGVEEKAGRA